MRRARTSLSTNVIPDDLGPFQIDIPIQFVDYDTYYFGGALVDLTGQVSYSMRFHILTTGSATRTLTVALLQQRACTTSSLETETASIIGGVGNVYCSYSGHSCPLAPVSGSLCGDSVFGADLSKMILNVASAAGGLYMRLSFDCVSCGPDIMNTSVVGLSVVTGLGTTDIRILEGERSPLSCSLPVPASNTTWQGSCSQSDSDSDSTSQSFSYSESHHSRSASHHSSSASNHSPSQSFQPGCHTLFTSTATDGTYSQPVVYGASSLSACTVGINVASNIVPDDLGPFQIDVPVTSIGGGVYDFAGTMVNLTGQAFYGIRFSVLNYGSASRSYTVSLLQQRACTTSTLEIEPATTIAGPGGVDCSYNSHACPLAPAPGSICLNSVLRSDLDTTILDDASPLGGLFVRLSFDCTGCGAGTMNTSLVALGVVVGYSINVVDFVEGDQSILTCSTLVPTANSTWQESCSRSESNSDSTSQSSSHSESHHSESKSHYSPSHQSSSHSQSVYHTCHTLFTSTATDSSYTQPTLYGATNPNTCTLNGDEIVNLVPSDVDTFQVYMPVQNIGGGMFLFGGVAVNLTAQTTYGIGIDILTVGSASNSYTMTLMRQQSCVTGSLDGAGATLRHYYGDYYCSTPGHTCPISPAYGASCRYTRWQADLVAAALFITSPGDSLFIRISFDCSGCSPGYARTVLVSIGVAFGANFATVPLLQGNPSQLSCSIPVPTSDTTWMESCSDSPSRSGSHHSMSQSHYSESQSHYSPSHQSKSQSHHSDSHSKSESLSESCPTDLFAEPTGDPQGAPVIWGGLHSTGCEAGGVPTSIILTTDGNPYTIYIPVTSLGGNLFNVGGAVLDTTSVSLYKVYVDLIVNPSVSFAVTVNVSLVTRNCGVTLDMAMAPLSSSSTFCGYGCPVAAAGYCNALIGYASLSVPVLQHAASDPQLFIAVSVNCTGCALNVNYSSPMTSISVGNGTDLVRVPFLGGPEDALTCGVPVPVISPPTFCTQSESQRPTHSLSPSISPKECTTPLYYDPAGASLMGFSQWEPDACTYNSATLSLVYSGFVNSVYAVYLPVTVVDPVAGQFEVDGTVFNLTANNMALFGAETMSPPTGFTPGSVVSAELVSQGMCGYDVVATGVSNGTSTHLANCTEKGHTCFMTFGMGNGTCIVGGWIFTIDMSAIRSALVGDVFMLRVGFSCGVSCSQTYLGLVALELLTTGEGVAFDPVKTAHPFEECTVLVPPLPAPPLTFPNAVLSMSFQVREIRPLPIEAWPPAARFLLPAGLEVFGLIKFCSSQSGGSHVAAIRAWNWYSVNEGAVRNKDASNGLASSSRAMIDLGTATPFRTNPILPA